MSCRPGPGRVQVERAFPHAGELLGADEPVAVGGDGRVHRDHVGLGEQVVERVGGVGCERVVADHLHAQPGEAPGRGAPHGPQPHDAHRPAGELPGPEPLVGDGAVAVDLAGAHVEVGPGDPAGDRQQQADGQFGDRVGVAPGGPQHGDALGGGAGDVDVGGITPAGADGHQGEVEHRPLHGVGLHDEQVGALGGDALGQRVGVVDAQRPVVDPRVEHHVGDLAQRVEAGPAEGSRDERAVGSGFRHAGSLASRSRGPQRPARDPDIGVSNDNVC